MKTRSRVEPSYFVSKRQLRRFFANHARAQLAHAPNSLSLQSEQEIQALRQELQQMQEIVQGAAIRVMEEQERNATILSALGQGLFGLDSRGCVQFLNAACERLMGWTETELQGIHVHDLLHPPMHRDSSCTEETCPLLRVQFLGISHRVEEDTFYQKAGVPLSVGYFCTPIYSSGIQTGALIAFDDITERQEAARALACCARQVQAQNEQLQTYCQELTATQRRLEQRTQELTEMNAQISAANSLLQCLATTDGMTGLANHRSFQETIRTAWHSERRLSGGMFFSLMLLDVDCFKQYNDAYGHPAGDDVLKTVARLLRENMRETDLIARYGGEEFVIVAWDVDANAVYRLASRLCSIIEQHDFPHRKVTVSIGVVTYDAREQTENAGRFCYASPDAMIKSADEALYAAKHLGRNRVCQAAGQSL